MSEVGFVFIPEHIMAREDLNLQEKFIYGRIVGLTKKEGYCYATNDWIGKQVGLSANRVSRYISSLAKKNLIIVELIKKTKAQLTKEGYGEFGTEVQRMATVRKIFLFLGETTMGVVENNKGRVVENNKYSNTEKVIEKENFSSSEETPSTNPDLQEHLKAKALRKAKKEAKKKYGGKVPPWMDLEKEAEKESVTITQDYQKKTSKYPDLESVTEEVLKEIAKDERVKFKDVEGIYKQLSAKIRSGETKPWLDIKQQLLSWVSRAITNEWIERKMTYKEYVEELEKQIVEEYGEIL